MQVETKAGTRGIEIQAPPLPAVRLVRVYSIITLLGVAYGVAAAHLPALVGQPWTTCRNIPSPTACVWAFHLYDVPLLLFNLWFGWYGLKRYAPQTVRRYTFLLTVAVVVNVAFFTFEAVVLLASTHRGAPAWELLGLVSVALMLIGGAVLAVIVRLMIDRESPAPGGRP